MSQSSISWCHLWQLVSQQPLQVTHQDMEEPVLALQVGTMPRGVPRCALSLCFTGAQSTCQCHHPALNAPPRSTKCFCISKVFLHPQIRLFYTEN